MKRFMVITDGRSELASLGAKLEDIEFVDAPDSSALVVNRRHMGIDPLSIVDDSIEVFIRHGDDRALASRLLAMYEAREALSEELGYEGRQKRVALIGATDAAHEFMRIAPFSCSIFRLRDIEKIGGSSANFKVQLAKGAKGARTQGFDAIVLFTRADITRRAGVYSIDEYTSEKDLIEGMSALLSNERHKARIDARLCSLEKYCSSCLDVCNGVFAKLGRDGGAIAPFEKAMRVDPIACIACHACIPACPSLCIEKEEASFTGALRALRLYDKAPLLLVAKRDIAALRRELDALALEAGKDAIYLSGALGGYNILALPSITLRLDEYLGLVEELGRGIIIYDSALSKEAREAIALTNEITSALYGGEALSIARASKVAWQADEQELIQGELAKSGEQTIESKSIQPSEQGIERKFIQGDKQALEIEKSDAALADLLDRGTSFTCPTFLYESTQNPRVDLSTRLAFGVGERDLGMIDSPLAKRLFTNLGVNKDACTLCMGCAQVCKEGAFIGSKGLKALLFTPSLCTGCLHCVDVCPEHCIGVDSQGLELREGFFKERVVSEDEPFACVMCGEEFATKKSIERVASMMENSFRGDRRRMQSLFCCPTCKVKVMMGASMPSAAL